MDVYAQYSRWRVSTQYGIPRLGNPNRRLAVLLGDFVYESSSAEDESRRVLEWLYEPGKSALTDEFDLSQLERFTSEHNRTAPRSFDKREPYVPWSRIDNLSQEIVHALSDRLERKDQVFRDNLVGLDRMFASRKALRKFRNKVDHFAPSDAGGRIHFYRDSDTPVTVRDIWGWTEVAASYWLNSTHILGALSLATGIPVAPLLDREPLLWPPRDTSIHGLRVLRNADISVPPWQLREAEREWYSLTRRWRRR